MPTKVTLVRVVAKTTDKENKPLMGKNGKPYTRLGITTTTHGDKWLSGFQNKDNQNWKEGDTVDIIITENGQYLNFDTPKAEDRLNARVAALEVQVMNLTNMISKAPLSSNLEQPKGVSPQVEPTPSQLNAILGETEPDF